MRYCVQYHLEGLTREELDAYLAQQLKAAGVSQPLFDDTARQGMYQFLRDTYIAEFNAHFTVAAAQKGSAFVRVRRKDLDWIFSVQHQRTVNNDNTIQYANRIFFAGQFMKTHDSLAFREPRTAHKL
jgi:hypothetical protein